MFEIDYVIRSDSELVTMNWRTVSESDLLYDCFLGDALIIANGVDLSARWGCVTLLDFVISLRIALKGLEDFGRASIDFTETDSEIVLSKELDLVSLRWSFVSEAVAVSWEEFAAGVNRIEIKFLEEIERRHLGLKDNFNYQRLLERVS